MFNICPPVLPYTWITKQCSIWINRYTDNRRFHWIVLETFEWVESRVNIEWIEFFSRCVQKSIAQKGPFCNFHSVELWNNKRQFLIVKPELLVLKSKWRWTWTRLTIDSIGWGREMETIQKTFWLFIQELNLFFKNQAAPSKYYNAKLQMTLSLFSI